MATAYNEVFEARPMREVKGKNVHLSLPPLTTIESIAFECLKKIAREGRQATQAELCAATGAKYQHGTVPAILKRLEEKGYIERRVFQRGLQVCIPALGGVCTVAPSCTVPHWRTIPDRAPVPAIQSIRSRDVSFATWIETTARKLGRDQLDFMQELMARGRRDFEADEAESES